MVTQLLSPASVCVYGAVLTFHTSVPSQLPPVNPEDSEGRREEAGGSASSDRVEPPPLHLAGLPPSMTLRSAEAGPGFKRMLGSGRSKF